MMSEQIENTSEETEIIKKEPNRKFGVEKYNNWSEKVTRGFNKFDQTEERTKTIEVIQSMETKKKWKIVNRV